MTVSRDQPGDTAQPAARIVEITRDTVELFKILKFEGMVTSGGEAKMVIGEGRVLVNGKPELQKRFLFNDWDTIEFNAERIVIRLASAAVPETPMLQTQDARKPDGTSAARVEEKA